MPPHRKESRMRIKAVLGIWLLGITPGMDGRRAGRPGCPPWSMRRASPVGWWQLRQHAIYLSGLWSIGLMALVMLLALAPAAVRPPDGRHGPGLPPAQMDGHCRRPHRHRPLGRQGVGGWIKACGVRGQAGARGRAALADRCPRFSPGSGRVGLLPAAGHGGPHADCTPAAL